MRALGLLLLCLVLLAAMQASYLIVEAKRGRKHDTVHHTGDNHLSASKEPLTTEKDGGGHEEDTGNTSRHVNRKHRVKVYHIHHEEEDGKNKLVYKHADGNYKKGRKHHKINDITNLPAGGSDKNNNIFEQTNMGPLANSDLVLTPEPEELVTGVDTKAPALDDSETVQEEEENSTSSTTEEDKIRAEDTREAMLMASRYQKMLADGPAPEEDEDKSSDNEPIKMGKISKAKKKKDRMHMRRKMPGYKLDKKEKLEKKEKKVKKEKKIKKDKKKHNSEKSHKSSCALDADCGDGSCCVEKKRRKVCVAAGNGEVGKRCNSPCVCQQGLECFVSPVKKKGKKKEHGSHHHAGHCVAPHTADLQMGYFVTPTPRAGTTVTTGAAMATSSDSTTSSRPHGLL